MTIRGESQGRALRSYSAGALMLTVIAGITLGASVNGVVTLRISRKSILIAMRRGRWMRNGNPKVQRHPKNRRR
jgi:hypothetical protein